MYIPIIKNTENLRQIKNFFLNQFNYNYSQNYTHKYLPESCSVEASSAASNIFLERLRNLYILVYFLTPHNKSNTQSAHTIDNNPSKRKPLELKVNASGDLSNREAGLTCASKN